MENNLDKVAKDLYGKIQSRFPSIKIGDENAEVITTKRDIPNARFFEFEYTENEESLGTITITLDEEDGIVVQMSGDISDAKSSNSRAYKFIRSFRKFAKSRMLNFDVQNIGKSNLDKRDYQFQAKPKETAIMENKMFGTSRISYQQIGESRLIVKHSQPVNQNVAAGRSMHINDIYIENASGERFKYPFKHLPGARALAEHINHGGNPYDAIGKHITGLSEELQQLRKFNGYVKRQDQISESMGAVTSKVIERIESIKKEVINLQKRPFYEKFAESFEMREDKEIPETIMNDWVDRLTVRSFNEDLKSVFPYLYNMLDESDLPVRELGADDISEMFGKSEPTNKQKTSTRKSLNPESVFEAFIEDISQSSGTKLAAFNELLGNKLAGGDFGKEAIDPSIIKDQHILDTISNINFDDKDAEDVAIRDLISDYINSNNPEIIKDLPNLYITNPGEVGGQNVPDQEPLPAPEAIPAPAEVPAPAPAPMPAPAAGAPQQPMPMAESVNRLAKVKAKFIQAKESGATLETAFAEGMTIADALREFGISPAECGYAEPEEEDQGPETDPKKSGIDQLLSIIAGFWNREKKNFTIGGTRCKIKVKKAYDDGDCPNANETDVKRVFQLIDMKDPSSSEQDNVLKLAGVKQSDDRENDLLNNVKVMQEHPLAEGELAIIKRNAGIL
jgi:hypothetical protein